MRGDAELPSSCGKRLRNRCAADCDKAQAFWGKHALGFELGNPASEELRHQHCRRRLPAFERATHVCGAARAEIMDEGGGEMRACTNQDRHANGGDGLKEQRERQDREVKIALPRLDRRSKRARLPVDLFKAETDAREESRRNGRRRASRRCRASLRGRAHPSSQ